MRKIEQQMMQAIRDRRDWQAGNTGVFFSDHVGNPYLDATVYLHANPIAEVLPDGTLNAVPDTYRRWPTATTASRLRALGVDACIRNGVAHIDGEPV